MNNLKTVPNQKVITVKKQLTDKQNYYTMINLNALESAGRDLKSGAFKLWVYFAKNQNNYTFALSSKEVQENFGIKIKQYNSAIDELIEKGYLVKEKGYNYYFNELPQNGSSVIPKKDNEVILKKDINLLPKGTRNNTDNTINTTKENTFIF